MYDRVRHLFEEFLKNHIDFNLQLLLSSWYLDSMRILVFELLVTMTGVFYNQFLPVMVLL